MLSRALCGSFRKQMKYSYLEEVIFVYSLVLGLAWYLDVSWFLYNVPYQFMYLCMQGWEEKEK